MRRKLLAVGVAAALSCLPAAAFAARAYLLSGAPIFAGPGNDFPVVAQAGRGVGVNVNGCLSDYSWCDVSLGGNRGWVYAGDLAYPYQNRRVPILEYGPRLSLPLITFSLGTYWDRYYRGRPFYRERGDWENRWRGHEHDHDRFQDRRERREGSDRRDNDRRDFRGNDRGNDRRSEQQRDRGNDRGDRFPKPAESTHYNNQGNEAGTR
ncbi:MAG TPA: SH3 domain-containing protein [Casimicrobiaceae bacterium]|nr:SH3 domain-containing protein [Casimicrobiaceae bacterium]